ncbi:30S ribosomal protein S15 [Candidatus Woesearchaeota archaeon CG10_big_fil_rev_8_21_14_0_10_36_11]|nr:MAG: 30S ribosomal protein S15 [Candidatus Woesearchaeota archaeon CG10_big_fil_rev_8_21_14_0_10_36_11]
MARMHSRDKGKSGSSRPAHKVPSWASYKGKEVEKLVIKYAKSDKSASEIGMILRDTYGIQSVKVLTEKSVSQILAENGLAKQLPEDLLNLIKKLIAVKQHLEKNIHDKTSKRGYQLTISKIRRLVKYYKKSNKLSVDWNLDVDRLKMYLE